MNTALMAGVFSNSRNLSTQSGLSALRDKMNKAGIDAWIAPTADPHSCEIPPAHWQTRKWLSGFNGSAGTLVILKDKAGLWTDGRYFIQAEQQLKGSGITLFKDGLENVASIDEWISDNVSDGACVGFDGKSTPYSTYRNLRSSLLDKNIVFKTDVDLLDFVWLDRPEVPDKAIFEHDIKFTGKSRVEKLDEVRSMMKVKQADWFLVSALEDIAWMFNIRGSDLENTPTALCYALISKDKSWLCIKNSKVPNELKKNLSDDGVLIIDYNAVFEIVAQVPGDQSIFLDPHTTSTHLVNCIDIRCKKLYGTNFTTSLKTIKNSVEIENYKNCLIRDCVYLVKFSKWLEENAGNCEITETLAAAYLDALRAEDELFHDLSFNTIAAFGSNGAMMHYLPSLESDAEICEDNFFLVDSGGNYQDGTTDITRTFSFGQMNEQQKKDYTLVVKSHINMARAVFLRGCRGTQIDYAARAEMWREGIHYNCATGHGVGFFLNVHEGPQNVGMRFIDAMLEPGMVVTNEPGIYRNGQYGIRIENIMLCYEKESNEFGTFNAFETISFCPIATDALNVHELTVEERNWLNEYHSMVYEKLSPHLDIDHKTYLRSKTKAV